jgi:Asp-tRNA(Asn)/Glu-tRNA(Gln) amidotransferase A subunit family amidase
VGRTLVQHFFRSFGRLRGRELDPELLEQATRTMVFERGEPSAVDLLWNITGQPAISLPLNATDDGVPVGVQLIGPPRADGLLLSIAAQLEAAAGWAPRGRPGR